MAISEELKIVVKAEVDRAISGLKKLQTQTDKNKKSASGFTSSIKGMVLGLGSAAAAVALLRRGFKEALDAAKLAADATQVEMAFESMASQVGASGAKVLQELSDAAGGTIDALSLMKSASRALVFDLPADKLDELMRIARASATATGESVEFMFESIVKGIARGSAPILDNLGILIKAEQAQASYAKSIGKTVEELSGAERSQATLNAVLIAGTNIMDRVGEAGRIITDAEKWQRLEAAVMDVKLEMGRTLLDAVRPMVTAMGDMARASAEAAKNTRLLRDAMQQIEMAGVAKDANTALEAAEATLAKLKTTRTQYSQIQIQMTERTIAVLRDQIAKEDELTDARIRGDMAALAQAERQAKAAADEVARQKGILTWVKKVNAAWEQTPEGREAAAAATITMWESDLKIAKVSAPQIEDILRDLKKQFDETFGMKEEGATGPVPFERARNELALFADELSRVGAGQDIDVAAILGGVEEGALAYKNAAAAVALYNDELMRMGAGQGIDIAAILEGGATQIDEMKERFIDLSGVITDTVMNAFSLLGEALVTGEEGWKNFAKGVIGSMASVLDTLAQQMFVIGLAKTGLAALGPGAAFAAAAAAKVAAGVIRGALGSMEEGGVTQKEGLYHLHPNEAVVPLDKAGLGGDTFIIMGDLVTQEEAYARAGEYQRQRGQAW